MFQITDKGRVVWRATYSFIDEDTGKRRFISGTGQTKTEAIRNRAKNQQRAFNRQAQTSHGGPTVETYLGIWLSDIQHTVSRGTLDKYRRDLTLHIVPYIGSIKLTALDRDRLEQLFSEELNETPPSARRYAYNNLRTMLNHAVKHDYLVKNPLSGVRQPKAYNQTQANDNQWIDKRINISRYLVKWIQNPECPDYDDHPLVLFMFLGLRRSELLGLTWDCVKQLNKKNHAHIIIKQQLQHITGEGWSIKPETKGKKPRDLPLPEMWRQALLYQRAKKLNISGHWYSDLVFTRDNGKPYTYNDFYKIWDRVLYDYYNNKGTHPQPLHPDSEYFRPHASRHIAASVMFDNGVPLEVVQQLLGHSDAAMTSYYTHITGQATKKASEALEGAYKGL